jgi:alanine dehydrogenase
MRKIGIRYEDLYPDEKRVALVPEDIKYISNKVSVEFLVESSPKRCFSDAEYEKQGAKIVKNLATADIIVGVKEVPVEKIYPKKLYLIFSHTIKGQKKNMPLLGTLLNKRATLLDYEKIVNAAGRRLIFFGNFAGYAGMINTLWALGKRLENKGIKTPLSHLQQARTYGTLEKAKKHIRSIGEEIKKEGFPEEVLPLTIGIFGYGNVSKGAQEILSLLPTEEISPQELLQLKDRKNNLIYKIVFKEEDMVEPKSPGISFELQDYYKNPDKYRSKTFQYLDKLTAIVNCIYWESKYPRILTKKDLKDLFQKGELKLKVIGDISCDVEGAIECTLKESKISQPVYIYNPKTESIKDGFIGEGIAIMAVSTLPAELPVESSVFFSNILKNYIVEIVASDWNKSYAELELLPELKRAIIIYQGELTPPYQYLKKYL